MKARDRLARIERFAPDGSTSLGEEALHVLSKLELRGGCRAGPQRGPPGTGRLGPWHRQPSKNLHHVAKVRIQAPGQLADRPGHGIEKANFQLSESTVRT